MRWRYYQVTSYIFNYTFSYYNKIRDYRHQAVIRGVEQTMESQTPPRGTDRSFCKISAPFSISTPTSPWSLVLPFGVSSGRKYSLELARRWRCAWSSHKRVSSAMHTGSWGPKRTKKNWPKLHTLGCRPASTWWLKDL